MYPPEPVLTSPPSQDLSNFKLAQNQAELSKQIDTLKAVMEMQGKVMDRLLEAVEGRNINEVRGTLN